VKPDAIIHLAAQVSVAESVKDPLFDADVNVGGTLRVLEAARESQVRNLVFASSAAIYGTPRALPITEDALLNPISPYGVAKVAAERYIRAYCGLHGMKAVATRYANVFGPRQKPNGDGGVVAKFVDGIARGERPVFFGDGEQTRDYIYVKDVAEANVKALEYLFTKAEPGFLAVNVSTNERTSLFELYALLRALLPEAGNPVMAPEREGDIRHSCLDNTRAMECLNWAPLSTLEAGLTETIAAVRSGVTHTQYAD
jgi:UDP-glucose 4-epimerase